MLAGTTALGTGGSVTAGAGTSDTLSMAAADAATASLTTTLAGVVTGFERFATTSAAQTVDLAKLMGANNNYATVTGAAATLVLKNMNTSGAGSTVNLNATTAQGNTGLTLNGSAGSGASDVLNLNLVDTTVLGTVVGFGTVTANNVETVHLTVNDSRTTTVPASVANTVVLADTGLSVLSITGNQGLALSHAGTTLTSLDASGMTLGALSYTSGALQYAATAKGTTTGGDALDFSAALDTVNVTEYAGANTVTGGVGADTIVGGTGVDVIYADNAGTKGIRTLTSADAGILAGDVITAVINGTTVTYTMVGGDVGGDAAADLLASTTLLAAAINANTSLSKLVTASAALGVITITSLTDGVLAVSGTSTDGATALTASAASGTVGATASNVLTGGTGADLYVFGATNAAPSATVFNTINGFVTASDIIKYAPAELTIVTDATAAVAGRATTSAAGVATFVAADDTLAERIIATEASIATGIPTSGQVAMFQFGADAYVFISNGTDGVGAGDQLIKLVGVDTTATAFDTITIAGHNITLA